MKESEKVKVIDLIVNKVTKRGIPINVRTGGNIEAAEWVKELLMELLPIDEPLGVVQGYDYDHCPVCNSVIGQSAYFCKHCGAYVRERIGK